MSETPAAEAVALVDRKLCFTDLETSGLGLDAEILELACIVTDPTATTVLHRFEAKTHPTRPVPAEVAAINGYDAALWEHEAWPLGKALAYYLNLAKDCVFVAHNAPFDWGMLERALASLRQPELRWVGDYHKLDTAVLAYPLVRAGLVSGIGLAKLATFFGIETPRAHRAMGDVETMLEVYRALMCGYGKLLA